MWFQSVPLIFFKQCMDHCILQTLGSVSLLIAWGDSTLRSARLISEVKKDFWSGQYMDESPPGTACSCGSCGSGDRVVSIWKIGGYISGFSCACLKEYWTLSCPVSDWENSHLRNSALWNNCINVQCRKINLNVYIFLYSFHYSERRHTMKPK